MKKGKACLTLMGKLSLETSEALAGLSRTSFWNKTVKTEGQNLSGKLEHHEKAMNSAVLGKPMSSEKWKELLGQAAVFLGNLKELTQEGTPAALTSFSRECGSVFQVGVCV